MTRTASVRDRHSGWKAGFVVGLLAVLPLVSPGPASAAAGASELIGFGPGGEEFTVHGFAFDTSADGQRTVMYGQTSSAAQPNFGHYMLRDGSTTVVLDPDYADANQIGISDNGRWVTYINHNELVRTDLDTNGALTLTPATQSGSGRVDVSDDGQTIGFDTASQLVAADTDSEIDVYVWHGGPTPSIELISGGSSAAGEDGRFNALTPDGRYVLFTSTDHTLLPADTTGTWRRSVYVRDLTTSALTLESRFDASLGGGALPTGVINNADITDNGQTVVFASQDDVSGENPYLYTPTWVRDRGTGTTRILAVSPVTGSPTFTHSPSISGDGRVVSLNADWGQVMGRPQSNWPQIAVVEVATGTWQLASHRYSDPLADGAGQSSPSYISADGRHVVFNSSASDLLATPYGSYGSRVYRYDVQGASDPDLDADGIDDVVDADGGDGSLPGAFADAVVNGTITFVPAGFTVAVTDAADPLDGARLQVTGTGTARVRVTVCGFAITLRAGTDVTLTCGSVIATVAAGDVVVELAGGLGAVTLPAGTEAEVGTNPGGGFEVIVTDATGDGGAKITLTVDGQTTNLGGGTTLFQAWDFVGFSTPIDNAPTINKVNGGRTVPVKWRLLNANGTPVTNLSTASLTFSAGACTGAGGLTDDIEQTVTGSSGLKNLGNGNYQMNWKTPTAKTPCGELHLTVGDGVVHSARFQIT